MNYKMFVFATIMILAATCDGLTALTAQKFPQSAADITFSQKTNLHSDGYEPYRDSIVYQKITIDDSPQKSQQPAVQGTVAPGVDNNDNDDKPNNRQNPEPYTPDTTDRPDSTTDNNPDSQPDRSQPPVQRDTQTPPNTAERPTCFQKDTRSAKRFVPPRVKNQRVYWWVGDSRFTGMYINGIIGKKNDEAVVAYAAQGHKWLTKEPNPTGISLLKTCLRDGDVVILNLGANDIWKYDTYISTYSKLMSDYPNVTFKVLSVNPVCDSKARLQNAKIETFNTELKNAFPANFIDTYSIVKQMVTDATTDREGLHYHGGNIEQTIYNTVMSSVPK